MNYQIKEIDRKFGCVDENEKWILVAEYDKIEISFNCAICWKDNIIQVYNLETKNFVLDEGCEDVRKDKDGYLAFKHREKWGVISTHGYDSEIILMNQYDDVKQLNGGLYSVREAEHYRIANSPDGFQRYIDDHPVFYNRKRILAKKGTKYGFINSYNCTTIPFIYDEIIKRYGEDSFEVRIGNSWGILSLDGREIIQVKYKNKPFPVPCLFYDDYYDFSNYYNYYISYIIDGLTDSVETRRVHSLGENYIWKDKYDRVRDARSGCMGLIDRNGNELIPPIYEFINIELMRSMPQDWKDILPDIYPKTYSKSDVFLFVPAITEFSTNDRGTWRSFGLYDIEGNIVVPVEYESLSYEANGYILASNYQGQQYDVYRIDGDGKCLISNIDRIYIDSTNKRLYLFGVKERMWRKADGMDVLSDAIDILDYCIPLDYDLKTILKNKEGEHLQLSPNTNMADVGEEYKIFLGGVEQQLKSFSGNDYDGCNGFSSVIYGNSIVFKRQEKQGICYLTNQSISPLYDELHAQSEDDLFIVSNNGRCGLFYRGDEILRPIYYGISIVEKGFCFIIKETYATYDIDVVNIHDIVGLHITAFRNLTEKDVDEIVKSNYLYFEVYNDKIHFNNKCPYFFTEEFAEFISKERILLKEYNNFSWYLGMC